MNHLLGCSVPLWATVRLQVIVKDARGSGMVLLSGPRFHGNHPVRLVWEFQRDGRKKEERGNLVAVLLGGVSGRVSLLRVNV